MARPRNYSSQNSHQATAHAPPYPERKQTHNGHNSNEDNSHIQYIPAPGPPLPQRQKTNGGSGKSSSNHIDQMGQQQQQHTHAGSTDRLASAGHSTHHGHSVHSTSRNNHSNHAASHPSTVSHKPTAKQLSKIRDPRVLEQSEVDKRLYKLHRRAKWLDSQFSCCCGMLRFGIDSLIGIIPVIGDFAGIFLAVTYMNTVRRKFDIPPSIVSQMVINIAIDFCVGLVPFLGDLIDTFFKANMRNYMLVEKYVKKQRESGDDLEMGQRSAEGGTNGKPGKRARIGEYIPKVPLNLRPDNIAKVATAGIKAGNNGARVSSYTVPIVLLRPIERISASAATAAVARSLSQKCQANTTARIGIVQVANRCFSNSSLSRQSINNGSSNSDSSTRHPERTCWRCQRQTSQSGLFCENEKCSVIQPVSKDVNYFDVLLSGRAPSFEVDIGELRRNFLKLQQTVHPDSYSQREQIEHKLAESQSSWINHAYATLKDPLLRAQYLLELCGNEISEKDKITDPGLLMEIMETREEIDMATTEQQMAAIKQSNDEKTAAVLKDLKAAFDVGNIDRAKQLTNHLQYLRRVAQAIHVWEPGKPHPA
ncbi:molecular chaperone [Coemansia asiatica]|uniref:Molecular chaperone n=1 Tax=Coemansia asiatica TaxID=1052880 RepID=A0A9W7XGM9_9FUNG|nr:molecular chaperone [Coemansia asiatica]